MYRHLVWDWNGTLLDDAWLCIDIINELLAHRGMAAVTPERYADIFGFPLEDYCRRLGFDLDAEPYERLSDAFTTRYEERCTRCHLRQDATTTLAAVRERGVEQSVLSAYEHDGLQQLIRDHALQDFFVAVTGVDNAYGSGKIARGPEHMRRLALDPGEVLLVGDTLHDVDVAQEMGVDSVLVPSGHQHSERLASAGVRVVERLSQIPALLA